MEKWKELLLKQERLHPKMQIQDFFKLAYQSEFAGEHSIASPREALAWLEEELSALSPEGERGAEPIGGGLCRLHLRGLEGMGLSAATINGIFVASAREPRGSRAGLEARLALLPACCREGNLPFEPLEAEEAIRRWREAGYPAVHHSEAYRGAYHPAYRVVEEIWCRYLEVFAAIDRRLAEGGPLTVAIDGNSAGGKSTLGALLAQVYDCNLFHMDDFFLRPEQRTPERFAQPGGNVDRERFAAQVLEGIRGRSPFRYRRFDCSRMALGEEVAVEPKVLNIVEGSYSLHPDLAGAYGLRIFMEIAPETQSRRILARNGPAMHKRFLEEWIPLEERYFRELDIRAGCDLVLGEE